MQPSQAATKRLQKGVLSIAKIIIFSVILVAMLVVPVWIKRNQSSQEKDAQRVRAEEAAKKVSAAATRVPVETSPRPIGKGLTFATASNADELPNGVAHITCLPNPSLLEQRDNYCGIESGDTSCRVALPVLCYKPDNSPPPTDLPLQLQGRWSGGSLAATQPVMGAVLESEAFGVARCEKEIGAGWAMASNATGVTILGAKGSGLLIPRRYWVNSKAYPANCWNSAP